MVWITLLGWLVSWWSICVFDWSFWWYLHFGFRHRRTGFLFLYRWQWLDGSVGAVFVFVSAPPSDKIVPPLRVSASQRNGRNLLANLSVASLRVGLYRPVLDGRKKKFD